MASHCGFHFYFPRCQGGRISFHVFMGHLCFHSFNKYCLSTSLVPDTVWVCPTSLVCTCWLPVFLLGCFPFFQRSSLYVLEIAFVGYMFWKYPLQVCGLSFHSMVFSYEQNLLILTIVRSLFLYCLLKVSEFCLANLRSYFHLKCILVYFMRKEFNFFLFPPSGERTFLASWLDGLFFPC